jgi:RNA polymerase sigma-70 factor (ECF subfamily)
MSAHDVDERALVRSLRRGDEDAFRAVVNRHQATMVRVAQAHVRDAFVAEEIAQDAWMCLLTGLDRFEGRSSLRTWLLRVVRNLAVDRGVAERRSFPGGSLGSDDNALASGAAPAGMGARRWESPPAPWHADDDHIADSAETMAVIRSAIEALPPRQRAVIQLHDVVGCPSSEVCALLDLSPVNQRVLLHRARERVRSAIDMQFAAPDPMSAAATR